jgi:predicted HicB family RNase H-like nuclease
MMNVLEYEGYRARVELDPDDECFVGRLAGINDVVGFHGSTIAELRSAFHEAVDDYIETCRKAGKPSERPYSGKVMFRISPEVHARAALAAQLQGKSLNQWAEEVLEKASNR